MLKQEKRLNLYPSKGQKSGDSNAIVKLILLTSTKVFVNISQHISDNASGYT